MALQCRGARFDRTNGGYQTGQPPGHGSEFQPSALLQPCRGECCGWNGSGLQTCLHPHCVFQLIADDPHGLVCQSKGEAI